MAPRDPAEASEDRTNEAKARELAELLGCDEALPSVDAFEARVQAHVDRFGGSTPGPGSDPESPTVAGWWLLRMAFRTYRRLREPLPPVDAALLRRFEARLADRPGRDEAHGQLFIDPPSALRRAASVLRAAGDGPVLAVGDDDAVSLALVLLGAPEVVAVDIDERILAFLERAARDEGGSIETRTVDVLNEPVPEPLRRRFSAVVTDPFRDLDGGVGFAIYAAACLRRDAPSTLLLVDHPEWNFEHDRVLADLSAVGLARVGTEEDLHAYPLSHAVFEPARIAEPLGLSLEWVGRLVDRTSAWSHLHALRRA